MAQQPPDGAGWRPTICQGGAWQMACDDWLLEQAQPAFRLYHWSRPSLSLGFHQRAIPTPWLALARQGRLDLVRRPSGGRAVLHAGGLTYALVWPGAPRQRRLAYRQACSWLQQAFADLGQPLGFGGAGADTAGPNCFATATDADLIHRGGAKRVGSAQFWRRGCLLQHGEILLQPAAELWQELFGEPPPHLSPLPLQGAELEAALLAAAEKALPAPLAEQLSPGWARPWRAGELAAITARLPRYRLKPDGIGVASPEASIERTT